MTITLMEEPRKGSFYLIPHHACGDKPKYGTRICQFEKREYLGCQLHGELMGYAYCFKLHPDSDYAGVRVTVTCDDKTPKAEILEQLYKKIKRYGEYPSRESGK